MIAATLWLAAPLTPAVAMPDPPEPAPRTVHTVPVEIPVEVPVEVPVPANTAAEAIRISVAALLGAALTATVAGPSRPRRRRPEAPPFGTTSADGEYQLDSCSDGRKPEVMAQNWPDAEQW